MSAGKGWNHIIRQLRYDLRELDETVRVTGTCSQNGTLRADVNHWNPQVQAVLDAAEGVSARTCESCGSAGSEVQLASGWVKTLCPECAREEVNR